MRGEERRSRLLTILKASKEPVSGTKLSESLKVSRQIIVQDVALLRADGVDVISTPKGYVIHGSVTPERVYKVLHNEEQTEEELMLIVGLGGYVKDVFIYHKVYGEVRAALNIGTVPEVKKYVDAIKSGESTVLCNATGGYHYHTVTASDTETLDKIMDELWKAGFLAKLKDYEPTSLI
ncbi:MAG: transcription repressor NadR [Lachnospiraceae bacterium]|nr:transcription repressor NadR [Lachnospiraceae bacterium]